MRETYKTDDPSKKVSCDLKKNTRKIRNVQKKKKKKKGKKRTKIKYELISPTETFHFILDLMQTFELYVLFLSSFV